MDLFSTIFDDKRTKRPKDVNRQKIKPASQPERTKNRTKQPTPTNDKRIKATNRSISQNDLRPRNNLKNGVAKSVSSVGVGHQLIQKSAAKKEIVNLEKLSDQKSGHKKVVIDSNDVQIDIRKPVPKSVKTDNNHLLNNYFHQSDVIEDNFESALEVYNDCTFDEKDDQFGRESFTALDKDYFLEAYNRDGGEIIQSSVQVTFATTYIASSDYSTDSPQTLELDKADKTNIFISDENEDNIGIEAYNSLGNEIRQISISGVHASSSQRSTIERITKTSNIQITESFMNELAKRSSIEQSTPETKSVQEIVKQKLYKKNRNSYRKKKYQRSRSTSQDEEKQNEKPPDNIIADSTMQHEVENVRSESILIKDDISPAIEDTTVNRASSFASNASSTVSRKHSIASAGSYTLDHSNEDIIEETIPLEASFQCTFEPKTKADMIIYELLETENAYIRNLEKINRDYISYFDRLQLTDTLEMFGNIKEILENTKELYQSLSLCDNNYEHIARTFVDYKFVFELYPIYSRNKSQADTIITRVKPILKDRQRKLGDKLDLSSYLLNPIQRLGRYILLLENLRKCVRRTDCLEEAINILKTAMIRGNDYVAICSIQNCPEGVDLSQKGTFMGRESFTMLKPRKEETWIFLFDQIVVFTTPCLKTPEKFDYKDSINMNDLAITCIEGNDREFRLKNYPLAKKGKEERSTYILEARTIKLKEYWTNLIETKLWEQLNNFKAQSKQYTIPAKPSAAILTDSQTAVDASTSNLTCNVTRRGTATSDYQKTKRKSQFYIESTTYGTM